MTVVTGRLHGLFIVRSRKEQGIRARQHRQRIYGGDVPEDTCYDWAEEYYRDANAKEDEVMKETFVPKPYLSPGPARTKRQPKKEKLAAKPAPVIQMPKAEPEPKEEQVSMFDMVGGLAG